MSRWAEAGLALFCEESHSDRSCNVSKDSLKFHNPDRLMSQERQAQQETSFCVGLKETLASYKLGALRCLSGAGIQLPTDDPIVTTCESEKTLPISNLTSKQSR
jgi:hypothetical protein